MNFGNHDRAGCQTAAQFCLRPAFYIFLGLGLLATGYGGYVIADAHLHQAIQFHKFAHEVPTVEPHLPMVGEAVGEIEIPRLALRAVILQGDSPQVLRRGVGHLPHTQLPGEHGNVGLAGHRDSFFRPLRQIRVGDLITVRTPTEEFQYQVESTLVVSPENTEVLASSGRSELTLVTCFPFRFVGAAPNRFIVRAPQVSVPAKMKSQTDSHASFGHASDSSPGLAASINTM